MPDFAPGEVLEKIVDRQTIWAVRGPALGRSEPIGKHTAIDQRRHRDGHPLPTPSDLPD